MFCDCINPGPFFNMAKSPKSPVRILTAPLPAIPWRKFSNLLHETMMNSKLSVILLLIGFICLLTAAEVAAGINRIRPSDACSALNSLGLPTLGWKTYYDDECGCSSRPKILGTGNPYRNMLSYFVDGKGGTVRQLRLIVSVMNPDEWETAHTEFQKAARFLLMKFIKTPAPESIFRAISSGINMVYRAGDSVIEISRKEWTMNTDLGSFPCYDIRLIIR